MKNKFLFLIVTLLTSFSFIHANNFQPSEESQECYPYVYDLCDCDYYDAYPYFTVGAGPLLLIPNLGLGYRQRYGQFGWDTALSFSTLGVIHQLGAHFVGHFYLDRNRQDSMYVGLGLLGSGIFSNDKHDRTVGTLSPDFVFGKELQWTEKRRHFIELHAAAPTLWMGSKRSTWDKIPMVYVKYGTSF